MEGPSRQATPRLGGKGVNGPCLTGSCEIICPASNPASKGDSDNLGEKHLPFGSEFSPSQISLPEVLDLAHKYAGDPEGFETAVRALYFESHDTSEYNRAKLANNTNLAMRAYGLPDEEVHLIDVGKKLYDLRRYKEGIVDMGAESDARMRLRPVAFRYRPEYDETRTRQYGLVAEGVVEVAQQLVVFDAQGRPETVRYHFVNAMLLNEVQKQRRLVEEQQSRIQDLEGRMKALEALLGLEPRP